MKLESSRREQLNLPFDQHQRYRIVAEVLDTLREDDRPVRILDVGGGEGIVLRFLTRDHVEILDQTEGEEIPNFVKGDATALPFEDEAFDYVMSIDVCEHIEPEAREQYLSELWRTARRGVLLAGPFDSEEVRGAERLANELHRTIHLQENIWLREHAENGLPDLDRARTFFEERGDSVTILPNGYLPHWLAMISLTFYGARLGDEARDTIERLNAFYNEFLYRHDNCEPCYRYLLISLREDRDVDFERLTPKSDERPDAALSSALFGTLSASLPLMNQLTRKEVQIQDLSRRLAHQVAQANTAATLSRENAKLKRQLEAVKSSRTWRVLEEQRKLRMSLKRILKRDAG